MSIKYGGNTMHIECDDCDQYPETLFGAWKECWADLKQSGWMCWKDETGAWCHACPTCAPLRRAGTPRSPTP